MAKKKGELSFLDLKKKMQKNSLLGNHSEMFSKEYGFIHTGNHMLNALLSADLLGGYPENRIISISGEKGTGKTFLSLNAAREFQNNGYAVKFYDSEGAINKRQVEEFGVSTEEDQWDYSSVSTVEDFRTDITNYIQELLDMKRDGYEIPKMLFILDSAGNLASTKEVEDALSGSQKADMTRAKVLKSVFRIITSKLAEIGATLIFTNHTYRTTDLFSKEVSSGGTGPAYAASIIIFLSKAQLKESDGKTKRGIIVTAKTEKNRFARPELIKFHIDFTKGMNPYVGLHEYLGWDNCGIENGIILTEAEFQKVHKKHYDKNPSLVDEVMLTEYELNGEKHYFVPKDNLKKLGLTGATKFGVKHLGENITAKEMFNDRVFSKEALEMLQENVVKKLFSYSSIKNDGLDGIMDSEDDNDENDNDLDVDEVNQQIEDLSSEIIS